MIAAGSTDDGTMVYSLEKEGTYTAALPRATAASTYKVWYKVTGDKNHADSTPDHVEVEIKKADPGIGSVTADVVRDTLETSAVVLTRANTDVDGRIAVNEGQSLALGDNQIAYTFTPSDTANYKTVTGTVTVTVVDTVAPTGTVTISTNSWTEFLNEIFFGLFFKETQTVSVSAFDELSDIARIEYIESGTAMDLDAVKAAEQWTEMRNGSVSVTLEDTKQFIYYIRITDTSGNIAYLSSDGVEYDTNDPDIEGVNNGVTYYTTQVVTVSDENIDTNAITLNGEAAASPITLEGNKEATYIIEAADKAGNSAVVTVVMAPIADIASSVADKDGSNVTSDDKANLQAVVDTVTRLMQDEDVTAGETAELEEVKANAEALLDVIEAAAAALDTENTEKVEDVTAGNVKPEDQEALEGARADLEKALEDNGGNYTEEEKQAIRDEIQRIEDALEALENIRDVTEAITQLPETVEPDDEEAAEKILDARNAYEELTDHEKSLVEETAREKLNSLLIALTDYRIVKGDGGMWTKGSGSDLSFTVNGPIGKFAGVEVDGREVASNGYTAQAGSTVITLKASFLEQLSAGEYTLTVLYTDGEASGAFAVLIPPASPATGDGSSLMPWSGALCVSTLGLVLLLAERKRRKAAD